MRQGVWMLVAMVGLTATSQSQAQFQLFGQTQGQAQTQTLNTRISPTAYVGSKFRLRDLFPSFNPFSNRNSVGRSNIPDPNSQEYLKVFGFKKLY